MGGSFFPGRGIEGRGLDNLNSDRVDIPTGDSIAAGAAHILRLSDAEKLGDDASRPLPKEVEWGLPPTNHRDIGND